MNHHDIQTGADALAAGQASTAIAVLPPLNFAGDAELGRLLDAHRIAKVDHSIPHGQSEHGKARKALMRYLNEAARRYALEAIENAKQGNQGQGAEKVPCAACKGSGDTSTCTDCNGKGYHWEPLDDVPDEQKALSLDLVTALENLESANDVLCGLRTREQYLSLIDGGQADALCTLDNARRDARKAIANAQLKGLTPTGDAMPATPDQVQACSAIASSVRLLADPHLRALVEMSPGLQLDALRWRVFLASARIRSMGSAGLSSPLPNNYAHMGLEIWTKYGTEEDNYDFSKENARSIEWLNKYAEVAAAAQGIDLSRVRNQRRDMPVMTWVSVHDQVPTCRAECSNRDMLVSETMLVRGLTEDGSEGLGLADFQADGKWHCYGGDYDFMHVREVTHFMKPANSNAEAAEF